LQVFLEIFKHSILDAPSACVLEVEADSTTFILK